jgi:hypothetical protein
MNQLTQSKLPWPPCWRPIGGWHRPFAAAAIASLLVFSTQALAQEQPLTKLIVPPPAANAIRVATFNVALNRKALGDLAMDLKQSDEQATKIAAIIQSVAPDILLVNELDYDEETAKLFLDKFLKVAQPAGPNQPRPPLNQFFAGPVNTGVDSGLDLNQNDRLHDPDDAWGYGAFPGQYGMAVYSRFPILSDEVRTFQNFRWSQMPNAMRPMAPNKSGGPAMPYHSDEIWNQLRLSSKSHWDVPIDIDGRRLHLIASHPTPPVFDGPEDRNGCRNHDEIRMLHDYVGAGDRGAYLVDDRGRKGPIDARAPFVIVGDLNSDPVDGDGVASAIQSLLKDPVLASMDPPISQGAVEASQLSGNANAKHRGNPAHDTGDFNDKTPGNLRIDFVLPSANCKVIRSGVYWPSKNESESAHALAQASDHRLVWVDIVLP